MSEVERLAAELAALRQQVTDLSRESRLQYSSMEGGGINVYQPGTKGQPGATLGQQYDGTYGAPPLGGPTPPKPSTPTFRVVAERLFVTWDGTWDDSPFTVAPLDFARTEVHVSVDPGLSGVDFSTMVTPTIETARGGEVPVLGLIPDTDYYIRLSARSHSGKFSAASNIVGPIQVHRLTIEDLDIEAIGGNMIYRQDSAPTGEHRIGDLWLKTPENIPYRWEGDPGSWVASRDAGIAEAINEAFEANQAANQAGIDALAAQSTASNAQTSATNAANAAAAANTLASQAKTAADSKITVYRQATAPSGGTYKVNGDLWIDSDDGLVYYASTTSGSWLATPDQRIATALSTANTANSTVATKTTVFAQISAPTTTGRTIGDIWLDTDDGNKRYVWDGAWTASAIGAAGISATARQLGAVSTYRQSTAPVSGMLLNDLWIDSDDGMLYVYTGTWTLSRDTGIQQALNAASGAQTTANAKTTTYYQTSAPVTTGRVLGDLWVDTDDGNLIYTWNGTAWAATRFAASAISATARQLGAITTYRQSAAPASGMVANDLWIDSDDNKLYSYDGAAWVASQDTGIQQALTAASGAQTTANTKTTTYYQISAPPTTARVVGDLWVDTDDGNRIYTWNGTAWTLTQFAAQAISATARQLGGITTYRQATAPASGMINGDFWIDSDDNVIYRYDGATWTRSQDTNINTAITNAATAQSTADGKMRIFAQASAPTGLGAGDIDDLWIDTDDGNKTYRWNTQSAYRRTNYAVNPSFEYDAPMNGIATGWTGYREGLVGNVGWKVQTTLPTHGAQRGQVSATNFGLALDHKIGFEQEFDCAPGDVIRVLATMSVANTHPNHALAIFVEWRTAAGAAIGGAGLTYGSTTTTASQQVRCDTTAAPANAARVRVKFWRMVPSTTSTGILADLNLDAVVFEKNAPAAVPLTYFDGSSTGETRWVGEANNSYSETWTQVGGTLGWVPNLIRTAAIEPASLVAKDVVATGTVSAALLEVVLVLATTIVAGDPNGAHARMTPTGFRVFRQGADGGPSEAVRLGTQTDDFLGIIDANGRIVGSFGARGDIYGQSISVTEWPSISAPDHTGQGGRLNEILDRRGRGLVAWGGRYVDSPDAVNGSGIGIFEIGARLREGRMYKIHTSPLRVASTSTTNLAVVRVHYETGGFNGASNPAMPSINSPVVASGEMVTGSLDAQSITINKLFGLSGSPNDYRDYRFLLAHAMYGSGNTAIRGSGGGAVIELWIEDIGPYIVNRQQVNSGGGTSSAATPPPPPPTAPPPQRYNRSWNASWAQTYRGDGSVRGETDVFWQGYGDSYNGNQQAFIGFPSDIQSAINGGSVEEVGLYLFAEHWWSYSGGTAVIGTHNYGSPPGQLGGLRGEDQTRAGFTARGQGQWISLFNANRQGWSNGQVKGVMVGFNGAGTNNDFYARFAGPGRSNVPVINITWVK